MAKKKILPWRLSPIQQELMWYQPCKLTCHWHNSIDYTPGTFLGYDINDTVFKFKINRGVRKMYICDTCHREFGRRIYDESAIKIYHPDHRLTTCKMCQQKMTQATQQYKDKSSKGISAAKSTRRGKQNSINANKMRKGQRRTSLRCASSWESGARDLTQNSCKTFQHITWHGKQCKLQGTYELKYAQWLDKNRIDYYPHPPPLRYVDVNNKHHLYYPDFYIADTDEYVEIKSNYWMNRHFDGNIKLNQVRDMNPHIKLTLLLEKELRAIGIDVSNDERTKK